MFDPVSGDSRIVLGDAVLDFIDENKPLSIESVPQAELEQQHAVVPQINYRRYGRRSRITTYRLDACQYFPRLIVPMEGDLPWRMRDKTFKPPVRVEPGTQFSNDFAFETNPEALETMNETMTQVIQRSRDEYRERQVREQLMTLERAIENIRRGEPEADVDLRDGRERRRRVRIYLASQQSSSASVLPQDACDLETRPSRSLFALNGERRLVYTSQHRLRRIRSYDDDAGRHRAPAWQVKRGPTPPAVPEEKEEPHSQETDGEMSVCEKESYESSVVAGETLTIDCTSRVRQDTTSQADEEVDLLSSL